MKTFRVGYHVSIGSRSHHQVDCFKRNIYLHHRELIKFFTLHFLTLYKVDLQKRREAKRTMGTTQLRSMRNPKIRPPNRAPPLPRVSESAAAITLKIKYTKLKKKSLSMNLMNLRLSLCQNFRRTFKCNNFQMTSLEMRHFPLVILNRYTGIYGRYTYSSVSHQVDTPRSASAAVTRPLRLSYFYSP